MYYPVCGMVNIKEPLLLIGKSGGSGFPLSQSKWSFTLCPTPYNRKQNVLSVSLNESLACFLPFPTVSLAVLNAYSNKMAEQVQLLASVGKVTALAFILTFGLMRLFQGTASHRSQHAHILTCINRHAHTLTCINRQSRPAPHKYRARRQRYSPVPCYCIDRGERDVTQR